MRITPSLLTLLSSVSVLLDSANDLVGVIPEEERPEGTDITSCLEMVAGFKTMESIGQDDIRAILTLLDGQRTKFLPADRAGASGRQMGINAPVIIDNLRASWRIFIALANMSKLFTDYELHVLETPGEGISNAEQVYALGPRT